MRVALLLTLVAFLTVYAWRDWFKALCGLILLMAVMQHPDMPKSMMGIQGLNPWNVAAASVILSWLASRQREGLVWDMPGKTTLMLLVYFGVVVVSFSRMFADRVYLEQYSKGYLISEHLVNVVKWLIPGILLFDGCRTRRRLTMGLVSLLAVYFLISLQVIRWMPAGAAMSGKELQARALKILVKEVGFHRVNLSMMLSGASWAVLATLPMVTRRWVKLAVIGLFLVIAYGQALTGGRMGYVTWGLVGLVLCLVRWRKQLLLLPIVPLVIAVVVPGAVDRLRQGFDPTTAPVDSEIDDYTVTSGRTLIWPFVIDKIKAAPMLGYGRLAMARTGLHDYLKSELKEDFPHPHNAYLEMLLDNGVIGFILVMPFYVLVLARSIRLFHGADSPLGIAIGGATCALVTALLIASMGSQTFYPREGSVGMWAAIFLMFRVWVDRSKPPAQAPAPAEEAMLPAIVPQPTPEGVPG